MPLDPASDSRTARRLAAILAADVTGYSRLMQEDEERTLSALRSHLEELFRPRIAECHGRIVKLMGDGVLVEYASVVDAVKCAVELQAGIAERNAATPPLQRLDFRIGVNLGDVIVEGDDIYGDGVNVATRIQDLADSGGICVSDVVHKIVANKLNVAFVSMGEQRVKNIAEPLHVYRVDLGPRLRSSVERPADDRVGLARPSIAVLPLRNISGHPDQEYFADGITEDITTALARVKWILVISRNSAFTYKGRVVDARRVARELEVDYILEGSLQKAGSRVRINSQLIDGWTGAQVWAKRFDRQVADIFLLQDELTETIVGAIEPELGRAERYRVQRKRPSDLDAWDLCQRGLYHLYRYTERDLDTARGFFEQAVDRDPGLGPAYSGLAEVDYYACVYGFSTSPSEYRERALSFARRGVELDPEDPAARCTLGRIHYLRREHALARPELEHALDLNPSLALGHYGLGAVEVFSGRPEEAIGPLESAIRLSPSDPNMGSFLVRLVDAHVLMRRHEEAIVWARKALQQPGFQWSRHAALLAALGHLGRTREAKAALKELLAKRPDFSRTFVRETHLFVEPTGFAYYLEGLERAGVPD